MYPISGTTFSPSVSGCGGWIAVYSQLLNSTLYNENHFFSDEKMK
jgi:hypothetical protein